MVDCGQVPMVTTGEGHGLAPKPKPIWMICILIWIEIPVLLAINGEYLRIHISNNIITKGLVNLVLIFDLKETVKMSMT